jgi:hypothetical protein
MVADHFVLFDQDRAYLDLFYLAIVVGCVLKRFDCGDVVAEPRSDTAGSARDLLLLVVAGKGG